MIRNTGSSGSSLIGSSQNTSNLPGLYGGTSLLNTSFPTERLLDGVKSQFFKYERLYQVVVVVLNSYLEYIKTKQFDQLSEEVSSDLFTELGLLITNESNFTAANTFSLTLYSPNMGTFDQYRTTMHKILDGMSGVITLNDEKNHHENEHNKFNDILYSREKLKEFIDQEYNSFILFDTEASLTVEPSIKPQVLLYIQRHGLPPGGCFESEKMSVIIQELIDQGVLDPVVLDEYLETEQNTRALNLNLEPENSITSGDNDISSDPNSSDLANSEVDTFDIQSNLSN